MTSPRSLFFDTYYHIYNRGNNREDIFLEDRNYTLFLNLYAKYIEPVADTFAYCLLNNHFHILLRTKAEEELPVDAPHPSKRFSDLFNAYAKAFNKAYQRTGSLFQQPFGRVIITSDIQLMCVVAYIHQNPQKHGLVNDFRTWKYSSYKAMLSDASTRLKRDEVLDWFGSKQHYLDLHSEWVTDLKSKKFAKEE